MLLLSVCLSVCFCTIFESYFTLGLDLLSKFLFYYYFCLVEGLLDLPGSEGAFLSLNRFRVCCFLCSPPPLSKHDAMFCEFEMGEFCDKFVSGGFSPLILAFSFSGFCVH